MAKRSFTLVELLAVMSIIALLTGLIVGVSSFVSRRAGEAKTLSMLKQMEIALDAYREDRGFYPPTGGAIPFYVDSTQFGGFRSTATGRPYLEGYDNGYFQDAWKRPFMYRCDGIAPQKNLQAYDLWSLGRDGNDGTDDDITNWKPSGN